MSPRARLVAVALGLVLVTGCDARTPSTTPRGTAVGTGGPPAALVPTFDSVPCPDDVTADVVIPVSCGFLTVLEDRSRPSGRTIRLFVARFDPPGGTATPDPVITLGHLATQDGYGDMAGGGQRTHRVLYLLDPRGIGHSTPSLACPEVPLIGPDLARLRLRDPARQALVVKAVAACHDRLVGQGIDLAAYDVAANAADIDDLRSALGFAAWNLMTNGDASRIAFEVARRYPAGLRSLVIDSPSLPSPDFLSVGPTSLDLGLSRLVSACVGSPACSSAFPDTGAMIRAAISALDTEPVTIAVSGSVDAIRLGHPIDVVVDGAALVRILRFRLGSAGAAGAGLALTTVRDAIDGKLSADDPNIQALASDPGDCAGLLTICEQPTLGALYSILCRDMAGSAGGAALQASLDGRPAYADVFSPSPLLVPCQAWGVAPAVPSGGTGLTGGVPTLVLRGVFDPYSAPTAEVLNAGAGAQNLYSVDVPNQSYNTLGFNECPRAIRNAWIDAPTVAPADTSCLAAIPPISLTP